MSKEEDFFKENFPEYVTEKGEFLSPYWDLFRAGVICDTFESKVKIEQLEKENAELDCQKNRNKSCYSCANATERCFKNEIGCPCQKYKSYTEENAELKEKLKPENCLKLLAKEGYIKFSSDNLTKARHIIRGLYFIIQGRIDYENNIGIADEMWRAKQFLNSEVEK